MKSMTLHPKFRVVLILAVLIALLGVVSLAQTTTYAETAVITQTTIANSPWVNLTAGPALANAPQAVALSLAAADFNGDSRPDLIAGYETGATGTGATGLLTFYPGADEAAVTISLPIAPHWLVAGDFNADARQDVVAATQAGDQLFLLAGDGAGGFAAPEIVALPGTLTALAAGEIFRQDGLGDLALGVTTPSGAQLLVYMGENGLETAVPHTYPLSAPITTLAIGQIDEDYSFDVVAVAGTDLLILHGTDQLALDAVPANLETIPLNFAPTSLALGDFRRDEAAQMEIALLDNLGQMHLLDRAGQEISLLDTASSGKAQLVTTKSSTLAGDDLLVMAENGRSLHILTTDGQSLSTQSAAPGVLATLDASAPLIAALPLRFNGDALDDLALLVEGVSEPQIMMTTAVHTFIVTSPGDQNDDHPGDGKCETTLWGGKVCTLRGAIQEANYSAGADEIQLNIVRDYFSSDNIRLATSLPDITEAVVIRDIWPGEKQVIDGINLTTGVGLHVLSGGVTLEDLTFQGFTNASIANPVIKLDGGNNLITNCQIGPYNSGTGVALTSAGNRIENSTISGNTENGIAISHNGNTIGPGNIIGQNPLTGNFLNRTGILITGGQNNTVGTLSGTPNRISGNRYVGLLMEGTASSTLIIRNHIGLDAAGTGALGNVNSGINLHGVTATTIGNNTTAGRNFISANGAGIYIDSDTPNTLIRNNVLGTDSQVTTSVANRNYGIVIYNSETAVQITNNIIAGSPTSRNGLYIMYTISGNASSAAHYISDNFIGTNDASGTLNWGHGDKGVIIQANNAIRFRNNTVMYSGSDGLYVRSSQQTVIEDNAIGSNGRHGIYMDASPLNTLSDNTVFNNTDTSIVVSDNNNTLTDNHIVSQMVQNGMEIRGSNNTITSIGTGSIQGGNYGVILKGHNNSLSHYAIDGADTGILVIGDNNGIGPDNIIINSLDGISIATSADNTTVRGNRLGVNALDQAAPNVVASIHDSGTNTTIGGGDPSFANQISGGGAFGVGVIIEGTTATVEGNKIGTTADGSSPVGNLIGIQMVGGGQSSVVNNTIAYNGTGILVEQGTGHAIIGNSIHSSTGLGIDLSPVGVTLNDSNDDDIGANNLQNAPVLTLAGITGSSTRAAGMLDSTPNTTFTIRLYSNATCDSSGYGEGRTYLGQGTVNSNASGQANINLTLGTAAPLGHYLTATATHADGSSSEFSKCFGPLGIIGADTFNVNILSDAADTNLTDGLCDSSASAGEQCTLRAAVQQANANTGANMIFLPAGTYPLTLAGSENLAATGDLDISDELILIGAGANVTVIQSTVADRVFEIRNNAPVTLVGVTVRGGNLATTANGAGILVNSGTTLELDTVSVQENQTTGGSGGGIYSEGNLTLLNSAVISNTAGAETNGGGGLYLWSGTAVIQNSTISGNQTKGNGGGIFNMLATATLNNVTTAYNTADSDNDGGDGGGWYTLTPNFSPANSVVAQNVDGSNGGYRYGMADCAGAFTTRGYNLIGDRARASSYPTTPDGCTGFGGAGNFDAVGGSWLPGNTTYLTYNAGLAPLRFNGGATLNHSPIASTSALTVDAGNPAIPGSGGTACLAGDQRGQLRPVDGGTDGVATCDRGAVEHLPAMLAIGDVMVAEGSPAVFPVTLSAAAQITFTVQYSTSNVTAVSPQDYSHTAGTLTFTPGQTAKTISVPTLTDTRNEDTETFRVRLYGQTYVLIADGEGVGAITDGSVQPALLINDVAVSEGDADNAGRALFTVSLNSASGKTVMVAYTTADGTAVSGEDYVAAQGQLAFAPGVTSQTIAINLVGDDVREPDETFTVQLSTPVNATVGDATGLGTITNDDTPALSIYDASLWEGNSGTSLMTFLVALSKPSLQTTTVQYATQSGTAVAHEDYTPTSGTLTFAPGETLKTISVPIVGDEESETNESFTVTLNTPTGGAIIADGVATGLILDDGGYFVYLPMIVR